MSFKKKAKSKNKPVAKPTCAVCGAECSDLEINFELLCEKHFDAWMALKRPPKYESSKGNGVGAMAQMKDFIEENRRQLLDCGGA